jgi:hypothetical protein
MALIRSQWLHWVAAAKAPSMDAGFGLGQKAVIHLPEK